MKKAKKYFIIIGIFQAVIAICLIMAGIIIEANTCSFLKSKLHFISNLSYSVFLIPDHVILAINGIGNFIGAFFSFQKFNISGKLGVFLGAMLVLWITMQIAGSGLNSFLQPLLIVFGVIEVLLGYKIYRNVKKQKKLNSYYDSSRLKHD